MKKGRVIVVGVLALAAAGTAFALSRPREVGVAPVVRGPAIEAVYASGPVEPVERADVRARVAGPVARLLVREGDAVQRGQLLAVIEAPAFVHDVEARRAELHAALRRAELEPQLQALRGQERSTRAQLEQARRELARIERLVSAGATPRAEFERARAEVTRLEGQLASLRAQQQDAQIATHAESARQQASVASLEARAADAEVRSPLDGIVLRRYVQLGESVAPNQNLLRVGNPRALQIEAEVDEADVARVRVGMAAWVRFDAFGDQVFTAHVARVAPDANRERKTYEVDLVLDEPPEGLHPGMTAEVDVITQRHENALLAPADAVREGAVWVVGRRGRAERRHVSTGIRGLTRVEVTRGLAEGERVVLGGGEGLRDGQRVRAVERPVQAPERRGPTASTRLR